MKTLNLSYPEKSDIKFKVSKFPDGQQQVTVTFAPNLADGCGIQIKSRLNNFKDLELLICAKNSLNAIYPEKRPHLYVPYFLGSRSDRKFEYGSNNYLKDVICPIINNLCFASVAVLDPHSDVLEACLQNFKKQDNEELVKFAKNDIIDNTKVSFNDVVLISPDAGAAKKIYKVAEKINFTGEILICGKNRGVDGKINKTDVPLKNLGNKKIAIIDDICDGGATFINIAKEIKEHYIGNAEPEMYLIVTHGIFSKGFSELRKYFKGIYCTNSYSDVSALGNDDEFVKQLNVF